MKWLVTALRPAQPRESARIGRSARAADLRQRAPRTAYQIAQVYAWRGEQDEALHWLERARLGQDPGLRYLKYDPFLRSIRGDSRFASLLERLNLPPG